MDEEEKKQIWDVIEGKLINLTENIEKGEDPPLNYRGMTKIQELEEAIHKNTIWRQITQCIACIGLIITLISLSMFVRW